MSLNLRNSILGWNGCTESVRVGSPCIFMHSPVQKKYAAGAAGRGRWLFPTRLYSPVQMKYAADAAYGDAAGRVIRRKSAGESLRVLMYVFLLKCLNFIEVTER